MEAPDTGDVDVAADRADQALDSARGTYRALDRDGGDDQVLALVDAQLANAEQTRALRLTIADGCDRLLSAMRVRGGRR